MSDDKAGHLTLGRCHSKLTKLRGLGRSQRSSLYIIELFLPCLCIMLFSNIKTDYLDIRDDEDEEANKLGFRSTTQGYHQAGFEAEERVLVGSS